MSRSGSFLRRFSLLFLLLAAAGPLLQAQEEPRFYRLFLRDKGTPERFLTPEDPHYTAATAHLTERALRRRAKVLPPERLVSTADLPLHLPYLNALRDVGAEVLESSRWFNSVMIRVDSATLLRVQALPFLDSVAQMRARGVETPFLGKRLDTPMRPIAGMLDLSASSVYCITDHYGRSDRQNRMVEYDVANRLGIAGEGVLVGVCDAGFDWRIHNSFDHLDVVGEYDFVNNDSATFDQEAENSPGSESHGTSVLSLIAGYMPDSIVGAAFRSSVILAKTEDIRSERQIEEDYLVAGLEWIEAQGGDVVNISLGYTTFDSPERRHEYSELDGNTAFGSRGINHLVGLGVVAVVSAGNEGAAAYRYVSVPGEADSAIAAAAVNSSEEIAAFSSRGFGSGAGGGRVRIKPDLAALGVGNTAASPSGANALLTAQGTSFASPVTAAGVALLLSAAPELRPWEVRALLTSTASRASNPDTAYGYGVVRLGDALEKLSRTRPIIGFPEVRITSMSIVVAAGTLYSPSLPSLSHAGDDVDTMRYIGLRITNLTTGQTAVRTAAQPLSGVARWVMRNSSSQLPSGEDLTVSEGDSISIEVYALADNKVLRTARLRVDGSHAEPRSTLCSDPFRMSSTLGTATPNPFRSSTTIDYLVGEQTRITLIIYNSLGQEVARLVDDEIRSQGYHSETFDAHGLPAGAYYYILSIGEINGSAQTATAGGATTVTGSLIHLP